MSAVKNILFITTILSVATVGLLTYLHQNSKSYKTENKIVQIDDKNREPELKYFKGTIDSGKTIYEILSEKKVPHKEIMNLIGSFGREFDLTKVRENHNYSFLLTPFNNIKQFTYSKDILNKIVAKRDDSGFNVFKEEVETERKVTAKSFIIEDSLYNSILEKDETTTLANQIAEIFSWDIDFYLDPKKGDEIKVLYEKIYKGDKLVKYGKILSAQYIAHNKTYQAFYYDNGKEQGYYDEKGRPLRKMFLKLPLKFGRITSRFSVKRFHPVDKRYKAHNGIDYGAPIGTSIYATADGIVKFSGRLRGYGKLVILKNSNGYKTYYAHCSSLLVKKGDKIKQGKLIAKVGMTGKVTGPHVHYEIRYKNKAINPSAIVAAKVSPIDQKQIGEFNEQIKKRLELVESLLKKNKTFYLSRKKSLNKVKG